MAGKLYLLPMLLAESDVNDVIPANVQKRITSLSLFFAENIKTTRRYLRKLDKSFDIDGSQFFVLNKKTQTPELQAMLSLVQKGNDAGIISEAGLPGIGDPGSKLIDMAHANAIQVVPLTGPSSFVLALIASGLNGQSFAFSGYLPVKTPQLSAEIKELEARSAMHRQTQIFMETPYRNNQLMKQLLSSCHPATKLLVAANITAPDENITTKTIAEWKKTSFDFHKKPTVFALLKEI
ncbi:MAG: SAM-dependent methyltransferase [Salinivirgaceae bacterium]|jgi:16S rRNA (cytidine1402-2'-O)-methyltransferase|nr:SAM-dependent methyltransferase [Salinivirgaceae bacterium]